MRAAPHAADQYRIRQGRYSSDATSGNNGAFIIPGPCGRDLNVIASDQGGWEHVSVSVSNRCPNWPEMCRIKDIFWNEDECVVQYHPAKSEYVNHHPYCLHLWRPIELSVPIPPSIFVGPRDTLNPTPEEAKAMRDWGIVVRRGATL